RGRHLRIEGPTLPWRRATRVISHSPGASIREALAQAAGRLRRGAGRVLEAGGGAFFFVVGALEARRYIVNDPPKLYGRGAYGVAARKPTTSCPSSRASLAFRTPQMGFSHM